MARAHAAPQINAHNDIAPLIGAAHLQRDTVALVQLDEIIGLQAHIVEFDEGQFLLSIETHFDRVHRQHAINREVATDIAQEVNVIERSQPFGIVGHDRIGLAVTEGEEFCKDLADAVLVGIDLVESEQLAAFIAP